MLLKGDKFQDYEAFKSQIEEHVETLKNDEAEFHLQIVARSPRGSLHKHGTHEETEEQLRFSMDELTAGEKAAFDVTVINMNNRDGFRADWHFNRGVITAIEKIP